MNNDINFTPDKFMNDKIFNNSMTFSRELIENERWYMGDEERLEHFFKREYNTYNSKTQPSAYRLVENQTRFWKTVGGKTPRIHSGLPKLATSAMMTLLTSTGFDINVNDSEEDLERLQDILEDNNFDNLFQNGVATESWAGYFFYRIAYDPEVSDKPIIELISPKDGEAIFERGRVIGYKFKTRTNFDSYEKFLEVHEIMIKNNNKVNVHYEAYIINKEGKKESTELPEGYEDYILDIDFIPAYLKNNSSSNSRFPECGYGESDYTSVQPMFHMLDDSLSQMELEIRNAKAIKFINEKLISKDDKDKSQPFDDNQDNIELLSSDMELTEFDIKRYISILQPELRIEKYDSTIKDLTAKILTVMGLSPTTVGLPGFESISASDKSQREREKVSLRTRNRKLKLWDKLLTKLFEDVLKFDDYINGKKPKEYEIDVNFSEYSTPDLETLIQTLTQAIQGEIMDINTAINELYEDKSDEEKQDIVRNIKIERGIPLLAQDLPNNEEYMQLEEENIDNQNENIEQNNIEENEENSNNNKSPEYNDNE